MAPGTSSSDKASRGKDQYQPALDGIRALAVAAVLCYHAGFSWAKGGFLGVDAFFVLSGFLITGLLLGEWRKKQHIDVVAFWARRARRLLPALFLMLIGVAFYALFLAKSSELGRIRGDALATVAYVANWRPIFVGTSYFDQYSLPSPLRHAWSLGIEEQYYIVWPAVVILLLRFRRGTTSLLIATVALLLGSALLMALLFQPGHDPSRVYYGTDTRAQSLLIGSVLAMLLPRIAAVPDGPFRRLLQVAGLCCMLVLGIFWSITPEGSTLLYRGGFLLLALMVAIVILAASQRERGFVGSVLSLTPLRAIGIISYGVYLWHWPLYMVLTPSRTHISGYELFAVRIAATLIVATASYHLLEKPVRQGAFRQWRWRQRRVSWSFAPVSAVALIAVVLVVTRGGSSAASSFMKVADNPMPEIEKLASRVPARVMIVGDSVAMSMGPGLQQVAPDYNMVVWPRDKVGCGFTPVDEEYGYDGSLSLDAEESCREYQEGWAADIASFRPDIVVMVFGAMDSQDRLINGQMLLTGTLAWNVAVTNGLEQAVQTFRSQGASIALLTFPCSKPALSNFAPDPKAVEEDTYRRINTLNDLFRDFAAQHPDEVTLIDLNQYACPNGHFTDVVVDGVHMREDGLHYSPQGSVIVANWLAPQLLDVIENKRHSGEPATDRATDGHSVTGVNP